MSSFICCGIVSIYVCYVRNVFSKNYLLTFLFVLQYQSWMWIIKQKKRMSTKIYVHTGCIQNIESVFQ